MAGARQLPTKSGMIPPNRQCFKCMRPPMRGRRTYMAKAQVGQGCLFEQDFLRRTLGAIANTPEIALTELVANAWDAGASNVQIALPEEIGEFLRIEDDGTGMSASDFRRKWMTLGYDRVRNQGKFAEFPQ